MYFNGMVLALLLHSLFHPSHHVVVSVLGLQHKNDLMQVSPIDLLRTFSGAVYSYDAFSDVGQIELLQFLHC